MKKFLLSCLIIHSLLILTACQQSQTDSDNSKIQESVEKIKAKIQENLTNDQSTNSVNKEDSTEKSE